MTSDSPAFLALDVGGATRSAALIGRVAGRWRLLGSVAGPTAVPLEPAIASLVATVRVADSSLAGELGLPVDAEGVGDATALPRLVARTVPPPHLVVVAAGARQLGLLRAAADASGWRSSGLSADAADPRAVTAALLDRGVDAVLLGAGDPPAADERAGLAGLAGLVAAAASRRPDLRVILAGGAAAHSTRFATPGAPGAADTTAATAGGVVTATTAGGVVTSATVVPSATTGAPRGGPLRDALRALRPAGEDARDATARATASLAEVLDRRVETFDVGFDAGLRAVARATGDGAGDPGAASAIVARAALVPPDPDDAILAGIVDWSTVPRDQHRLRDRLRDLRRDPWGGAAGDGALLRMAAARAALGRLIGSTAHLERPDSPDLVIAAGGAWAVAPGPAVLLALADVVRRPAVSQYAYDHARLLGPLGMIEDEADRRLMLADLADDLLEPLGSVVLASGIHQSRTAGHLVVRAALASTELDLVPGGLQLVDLPPGEVATAELTFREPVVIGSRGRRFEVEVGGGLGGLLVDLRDVPLRLPERAERRRELLAAWQSALWAEIDA